MLSDYNSIFQLGVVVNGVLFYLDLRPQHYARLTEIVHLSKELREILENRSISVPPVSGDISTDWAMQHLMTHQRELLGYLTGICSLGCLFAMIAAALFPSIAFPWWIAIPTVLATFLIPARAFTHLQSIENVLQEHNETMMKLLEREEAYKLRRTDRLQRIEERLLRIESSLCHEREGGEAFR